ncbi:hypothetical protein [Saezia sanguinis]|uniref:hypothetical protein n=1 Tax=Saezia sanguinis TaxID=1965230 RepID=UPI0030759A0E
MANKLLFPTGVLPTFDELLSIITEGLNNLDVEPYRVIVGVPTTMSTDLIKSMVYVQQHGAKEFFCWITFSYFELDLREESEKDLPYVVGTQTRGEENQYFATIIAYILVKKLGRIIYDDAHLLGNKDSYSVDELFSLVEIAKDKIYPRTQC